MVMDSVVYPSFDDRLVCGGALPPEGQFSPEKKGKRDSGGVSDGHPQLGSLRPLEGNEESFARSANQQGAHAWPKR